MEFDAFRSCSLRKPGGRVIAPLAHWKRWAPAFAGVTFLFAIPPVIPANAGTHCSEQPRLPPELQKRKSKRRASEASNAPNRVRQAGKQSEAADQATREVGFADRPGVAPRGQEAQADWGAFTSSYFQFADTDAVGPHGPRRGAVRPPLGTLQRTLNVKLSVKLPLAFAAALLLVLGAAL